MLTTAAARHSYSPHPPTPCYHQQTKLSNPHYKPEIAAQTTLVNFCVTEKGLEDQLLALVVDHERPDLQQQAGALVRQLAEYTITLKELEDSLLARLANAQVGNTYTTQHMRSAAHFSAPRHVPLAMPTTFLHCPVCPG